METAKLSVIFVCLTFIGSTWATTVGEHMGSGFCYKDATCGPSSSLWAPVCKSGKRQSPVNLPLLGNVLIPPLSATPLKLSAYKWSSFRMINNGHAIQFDFGNKGASAYNLAFADPLQVKGLYTAPQGQRQYRFASAHFHWGYNDWVTGSEHCIAGICSPMELHLVHYLAKFPSMAAAVASGDPNALAVIGVLINVSFAKTVFGGIGNVANGKSASAGTGALGPIVRNLPKVAIADHSGTKWVTVNEPLDLEPMLREAAALGMYTYQGSLTTPGCNEDVNWYVLKGRPTTSHQDLEAFRTIVRDGGGKVLTENHRPMQALGSRQVLHPGVFAY